MFGFIIIRRKYRRSLERLLTITLVLSTFVNLCLLIVFGWKFLPKNNSDSDIAAEVKQGRVLYNNVQLIEYVRRNFLVFRSGIDRNKTSRNPFQFIDKLLNRKTNGFFIEVDPSDNEHLSKTLFLERERNWTGLLIESNPFVFEKLNRNSYLSNTCISTKSYSMEVNFTFADFYGGQRILNHQSIRKGNCTVQCFPLMTYLMALNISHVNYFSLDFQGEVLDIVKQIDFNRIQIDMFSIENIVKYRTCLKRIKYIKRIKDFLIHTGLYHQVQTVDNLHVVLMRNSYLY